MPIFWRKHYSWAGLSVLLSLNANVFGKGALAFKRHSIPFSLRGRNYNSIWLSMWREEKSLFSLSNLSATTCYLISKGLFPMTNLFLKKECNCFVFLRWVVYPYFKSVCLTSSFILSRIKIITDELYFSVPATASANTTHVRILQLGAKRFYLKREIDSNSGSILNMHQEGSTAALWIPGLRMAAPTPTVPFNSNHCVLYFTSFSQIYLVCKWTQIHLK